MNRARIVEAFESDSTPLIRTDFSDDTAWRAIIAATSEPVDFENPDNPTPGDDGYAPNIEPVDDRAFAGTTASDLGEAWSFDAEAHGYVLVADSRSMLEALSGDEITLAYVDLSLSDPEDTELFDSFLGRTFRCAVDQVAATEANLSIANTDFAEFADAVGADGGHRGFEDDQ